MTRLPLVASPCQNRSIGHLDKRIDDLRSEMNHRFDDMKLWAQSEFRRLDERIDRLTERISKIEEKLEQRITTR